MLQKITEKEIEFMEMWHYPPALVECLFSNFDNLTEFDEERFSTLRQYQYPMISFEPTIDEDPSKSEKENFQMKKNVGDIYNFCARKVGKTQCTEKLDIPVSLLHDAGWECGFSSYDAGHINIVLDVVKRAMENHPILRGFTRTAKTHPHYLLEGKNGWILYGINMNLKGKSPGGQFIGKHLKKLWIEERSYETDEVFGKRKESMSELGTVFRFSGMTNFTKQMPAGKDFYKLANRKKIINLPQYINPYWDEAEKEDRIEEYGGEEAPNFRIFVDGEVIEDGVSEFDIERVQTCYNTKRKIKRVELKKSDFSRFKDLIIVERPKNSDRIFVCYKEGTEILTESGWKDFKEVTYLDRVLSLNPKIGQSSYTPIDNIIVQDYNGELIEYDSETLKFSVTPNHKMFVKKAHHNTFDFIDADKLTESYVKKDLGYLRQGKSWYRKSGNNRIKNIKFKSKGSKKYVFDLNDWLEFLGWYLSEGCLVRNQNYKIVISQKKEENRKEIKALLDRMKWNYQEMPDSFWMNSKAIYEWLKLNCYKGNKLKKKTIYNCYNKKVPNFVRDLNSDLINILLKSVIKGDGWVIKDGRSGIKTTSYNLANDLHELILKTGKLASISSEEECIRHFKNYSSKCQKSYTVNIWRTKTDSKIRPKKLKRVLYKGKVYCVETNPFNTIYVKYKGKSFWCGNCADIGDGAGGSDIIVMSEVGEKYVYLYNIILYNYTDAEQEEVFDWLITNLRANLVGIDCGDGTGRALFHRLEKKYPKESLVEYRGNNKVIVGFEKNERGEIALAKGKPICIEEFMSEWSVRRLKSLLYETRCVIPTDNKFDSQINAVISTKSGSRTLYACPSPTGDHLFDAWKVFSIMQWLKKDFNATPMLSQDWGIGVNSWNKKQDKEAIVK